MDFLVGFLLLALDLRALGFIYPAIIEKNVNRVEVVNLNDFVTGKCPKTVEPLCATNGKVFLYFENKCQLEVKNYERLIQGLREYYECPLSYCKPNCPTCASVNEPVCAVNVITGKIEDFPNLCEIERRICTTKQDWHIVDYYECNSIKDKSILSSSKWLPKHFKSEVIKQIPRQKPAESSPPFVKLLTKDWQIFKDGRYYENGGKLNNEENLPPQKLKCSQVCTLEYGPICAKFLNKLREFSSNCVLESLICETGENWKMMNLGKCSSNTPTSLFLTTACPKFCSRIYEPVCGTFKNELREFSNKCVLESWNCESHEKWEIFNLGPCARDLIKNVPSTGATCPKFCSRQYKPVCAKLNNEFRKFSNKCEVEKTNCESRQTWKIVRLSSCPLNTSHTLVQFSNCPKFCTNEYRPVCAKFQTKLKEFPNKCEWEKVKCETNTNWQIFKKGRCPLVPPSESLCPSLCAKKFSPVCASFNSEVKEFFNICELRKQACETSNDWKLLKEGPCRSRKLENVCENEILDPICATHNLKIKTFNNTCLLTEKIKSTGNYWSILHKGICNGSSAATSLITTKANDKISDTTAATTTTKATLKTMTDPKRTRTTTPQTTLPCQLIKKTITAENANKTKFETHEATTTTAVTTTTASLKTSIEPKHSTTTTPLTTLPCQLIKKTITAENANKTIFETHEATTRTTLTTTTTTPKATFAVDNKYYSVKLSTAMSKDQDSMEIEDKENVSNEPLNSYKEDSFSSISNNKEVKLHTTTTSTPTTTFVKDTKYNSVKLSTRISHESSSVEVNEEIKENSEKNYNKQNGSNCGSRTYEDLKYASHKLQTIIAAKKLTITTTPITTFVADTNLCSATTKDESNTKEVKAEIKKGSGENNKEIFKYYDDNCKSSSSTNKLKNKLRTTTAAKTSLCDRNHSISSSVRTTADKEDILDKIRDEIEQNAKEYNKENVINNSGSSSYEDNSYSSNSKYEDSLYDRLLFSSWEDKNNTLYSYEIKSSENDSKMLDKSKDSSYTFLKRNTTKDSYIENAGENKAANEIYSQVSWKETTKQKNAEVSERENQREEKVLKTNLNFTGYSGKFKPTKTPVKKKPTTKIFKEMSSIENLNQASKYLDEKNLVKLIAKQIKAIFGETKEKATSEEEEHSHERNLYRPQQFHNNLNSKQFSENTKTYQYENLDLKTSYEEYQTSTSDHSQDSPLVTCNNAATILKENVERTGLKSKKYDEGQNPKQYEKENISYESPPAYQRTSAPTAIVKSTTATPTYPTHEKIEAVVQQNFTKFKQYNSKDNDTKPNNDEIYNGVVYKAPVYDAPTYNFIYTAPHHAILPLYYPGHGVNQAGLETNHNKKLTSNQTNFEATASIPFGPLQFLSSLAAITGGFVGPFEANDENNIPPPFLNQDNQPIANTNLPHTYASLPTRFLPLPPEQLLSPLSFLNSHFPAQQLNLPNFAIQTEDHENNQKPKDYYNNARTIPAIKESTLAPPIHSNPLYLSKPIIPQLQTTPKESYEQTNISTGTITQPSEDTHLQYPRPTQLSTNSSKSCFNSTVMNQIMETLKIITNRQ